MRKLLTAFLALSCSLCFADTLIMKDGARHDGQVQSVTASSVLFLQNGATLTYSRSSVQSIEFNTASPSAASNTSAESSNSGSVVLPA